MTDSDGSGDPTDLNRAAPHLSDGDAGSTAPGSGEGTLARLRGGTGPKQSRRSYRSDICRGGLSLRAGLALGTASFDQLWRDYLALGGNHGRAELLRYLNDECGWSRQEHDIAAHAVNENCAEIGLGYLVAGADEIDA